MKSAHLSVRNLLRNRKGSALMTVVIFSGVMLVLTGSLLQYTGQERRTNERNRLLLRSRNMAENAAIYASEQITTKLRRLRSPSPIAFVKDANQIYLPADEILTTENSKSSDVEVKAGLTSSTGLKYIDPKLFPNDPNKGLQVDTATVQIIAKSTMSNSQVGAVTTYVEQDLAVDLTPLFQFGVFYNMDMEYAPGLDMTITGPVHTNGNLIARMQTGQSSTLTFADRVTAYGGFFAHTAYKGSTWMASGSEDKGPGGTGKLYFTKPDGTTVNIYDGSIWRDHFHTKDSGTSASKPTATNLSKFESFATKNLSGNLRTSVHQVPKLELPAVGTYDEVKAPKAGREIIEEPFTADDSDLSLTKISRNAGLYIVVNPDDDVRTGKYPDGSVITMLPRSYRCFLSYVNSSGSRVLTEVVLPGQPSYGYDNNGTPTDQTDDKMYQNNLPNRYTDKTAVGINQVLRIPRSGKTWDNPVSTEYADAAATTGYATGTPSYTNITDHVFYDARRATNNTGVPWNRSSKNYIMRPIAKIDFDMTRFRLAVERTVMGQTKSSAIYFPGRTATEWNYSVLNESASTKQYNLGINYGTITDFSGFPINTAATKLYYADPFRIYLAPSNGTAPEITASPNTTYNLSVSDFVNTSSPSPWSDGISIYIHSVNAENLTEASEGVRNRLDSGVRLWNGRGPVISLDKSTYPKRTGFTLATNDALYVVGHFNADGKINSTQSDNSATGGFSPRYPDSTSEMLCAVMGDAITVLSQPVFIKDSSNYYQTKGWADSLSAHRYTTGLDWSSSWFKVNPSTSNEVEGITDSVKPASMPNLSNVTANPGSGSSRDVKFSPTGTELSTCLLTGIVRTTGNQTSGGVHNFPRLLEYWPANSGTPLAIRGSMVALFESQVATEPWSIRVYQAAVRLWGLHQGLRDANHDVPLEPIVIGAHRLRYLELTATQYKDLADKIDKLPK